jgi:hypothetical protein
MNKKCGGVINSWTNGCVQVLWSITQHVGTVFVLTKQLGGSKNGTRVIMHTVVHTLYMSAEK